MKSNNLCQNALLFSLLLLPALAQAHPGHSILDMSAGAPHPGHETAWTSLLLFVALTGILLGARWIANRRR